MKSSIALILMALWVSALLTPSIVTLVEKSQVTIVFNLNEEEQKESPYWDTDLKQLGRQLHVSFQLLPARAEMVSPVAPLSINNPYLEIVLPPPEQIA